MWGGLIRAALPSVLSWGAKTFANSGIGKKLMPVLSTSVGDVFGGAAKFMRNYLEEKNDTLANTIQQVQRTPEWKMVRNATKSAMKSVGSKTKGIRKQKKAKFVEP